jgi:hypothetical protein
MAEAAQQVKWGIVSTIKAPAEAILNFAAYHLEAGAHRLFLYLDAPCPEARPLLKAHPKIRIFDCDDASWQQRRKKSGKPKKHQVRQSLNATRAYRRQAGDLDWLAHIDVDEFLWADRPIAEILGSLPAETHGARARPIEALDGDGTAFKGYIPSGPEQGATVGRIYPQYGGHIKGGFLSHLQGKIFVRTGLPGLTLRIHNMFQKDPAGGKDIENPGVQELPEIDLCHFHAPNWQHWLQHYRYRLEQGSYRASLKPARPRDMGVLSKHELIMGIETEEGEAGLRAFYDEICKDTPELRARLTAEGLLRIRDLDLEACRGKHFPSFG